MSFSVRNRFAFDDKIKEQPVDKVDLPIKYIQNNYAFKNFLHHNRETS